MALLNGMLGGTILVLPLIGINTGYLIIPLITIYFGSLSGYTTYLLVIHIGHSKTLKSAVTEHFHGKRRYSAIYSVVLAISIIALLISYFQLLIKQI